MKKLFIDTNVLIDLIDKRIPFYNDVAVISTLAEKKQIKLAASSISFINTFYVLSKKLDNKLVINSLMRYRLICEVSNIDEIIIDKSLISNFNDFEDAVQHYSALHHKCDILITRNKKDFKNSEIPVMTPTEFLVSLQKS
ncbi:PIN domain-containing protein [Flavobacterium sp.]|uniref:type II toxin-antitoxin system VapC family toxin n=1 Tax=Flavobacterium sp. TaxID=239 RepID=UPI00286D3F9E|nr:PIN domain-containing protein [Flavobacterium sp.]